MSVIVGRGRLRHQFWGEYSATIVIGFDTPEHAALALGALGDPWKVHPKDGRGLYVASIDSRELARQKLVLGALGADVKKIDSLKYSVDHGEEFEVRFPVSAGGWLLRTEAPREPEPIDNSRIVRPEEMAARRFEDSRQLSLFGEARNG